MRRPGMENLTGKTALVTGSTDGVSRLVARNLGKAGARVLVHGRDAERGARVVAEIESSGGETPEFQRQNREFAAAVEASGKLVRLLVGEHYNHFELPETLGNPHGPLGRAALELMGVRVEGAS